MSRRSRRGREKAAAREAAPATNDPQPPSAFEVAPEGPYVQIAEAHSGPVPHPTTLAGYEHILPGAAERIIAMAERDQAHQHDMRLRALRAKRQEVLVGQVAGLLIGLAALATVAWAIHNHQSWVASVLGGGTLVALVTVFVTGRRKPRQPSG